MGFPSSESPNFQGFFPHFSRVQKCEFQLIQVREATTQAGWTRRGMGIRTPLKWPTKIRVFGDFFMIKLAQIDYQLACPTSHSAFLVFSDIIPTYVDNVLLEVRINGLFHLGFLSTDPITFDPNIQPDIQVLLMVLESGDRQFRAEECPIFHRVSYYNRCFFRISEPSTAVTWKWIIGKMVLSFCDSAYVQGRVVSFSKEVTFNVKPIKA